MATAQHWVTELSNGTKQAFPNIKRSDMVTGLKMRLAAPALIDQASASLCGPAAFMYCVASKKAAAYAQYVVELYHTGEAAIGGLHVKPKKDCKNYHPGKSIAPVDWVALASLRDSENRRGPLNLDYDDADCPVAGITPPRDLVEWFWTSGFKDDAEFTNLILNKDSKCLNAAANRLRQQHSVCLLIDGTLLDHGFATMSELSKQVSGMPNHWVVLTSPAIVKQNRITLTLYSWGNIRPVHMPVAHFCRKFFGYVSGRA